MRKIIFETAAYTMIFFMGVFVGGVIRCAIG